MYKLLVMVEFSFSINITCLLVRSFEYSYIYKDRVFDSFFEVIVFRDF